MDIFSMVLSLLSGVALFLFGMSLMGDGLKSVAGNKLESFLYKMTNTPIKGVALGAGVTSVIQSSSATTVMVVGFVNSGMMKLRQAIGIIMGANIGTSITGWVLCLSYIEGSSGVAKLLSTATISAVMAIAGILFKMLSKHSATRNIGNILLGFSILMVGMQTMSGAVSTLRTNETFIGMLTMFSNPLLGILTGLLITVILQSSSASVGVLQALSMTGQLSFSAVFPLILGIGIGAASPVLLSAIGANKNGKRTALVYLLNDVFGMIIWSVLFYSITAFVSFDFVTMTMTPFSIALTNTVLRFGNITILFPFISKIESLVKWLVKDNPEDLEDEADFDLLEERLLPYPALAIAQCRRAMIGMSKKVRKNIGRALNLLSNYLPEKYEKVQRKEDLIDRYESRLGEYLIKVSKKELNTDQTRQVSIYLHTITDLERVADYAANAAHLAHEIHEDHVVFSPNAVAEMNVVIGAVKEIANITIEAFQNEDLQLAQQVGPLSMLITNLCDELKLRHVERLRKGKCDLEQGAVFHDLLNSFDRVAAHCYGVAAAMVKTATTGDSDIHIHSSGVMDYQDSNYMAIFEKFSEKYVIPDETETEAEAEEVTEPVTV